MSFIFEHWFEDEPANITRGELRRIINSNDTNKSQDWIPIKSRPLTENKEVIEQLENTILLIKQDGKDYFDERDIPVLQTAIKGVKSLEAWNELKKEVLEQIEVLKELHEWGKAIGMERALEIVNVFLQEMNDD